jgi:hypothetical protein
MKDHLALLAVGLYLLITLVLVLMPKRWLLKTAKKDFGTTEAEWKRKDNLAYYRILFLMGGLVTVGLVLILKYAVL